MKVAVCIPSYRAPAHDFLASSLQMVATAQRERPDLAIWPLVVGDVPFISVVRNQLARQAMDWDADWLLWLDNDHSFPPHTLQRLLAHEKPLIGANYQSRHWGPTARKALNGEAGDPIDSAGRTGIEEVAGLGFGICLVSAEVFRAVPQPWFALSDQFGEDYGFCTAARKAGFPAYVDHDLSLECGHVTSRVLKFA